MSDQFALLSATIRPDQDRLIRFISDRLGTNKSVVVRWLMDAGYEGVLLRAGLIDADIPADARPPGRAAPS